MNKRPPSSRMCRYLFMIVLSLFVGSRRRICWLSPDYHCWQTITPGSKIHVWSPEAWSSTMLCSLWLMCYYLSGYSWFRGLYSNTAKQIGILRCVREKDPMILSSNSLTDLTPPIVDVYIYRDMCRGNYVTSTNSVQPYTEHSEFAISDCDRIKKKYLVMWTLRKPLNNMRLKPISAYAKLNRQWIHET